MVAAASVFWGYTLEIFRVSNPIDLIPIPIWDTCMIVGLDCLSRFCVMIDCERPIVIVLTLSRGELTIYGKGTRVGLGFVLLLGLDSIYSRSVWVTLCMWLTLKIRG